MFDQLTKQLTKADIEFSDWLKQSKKTPEEFQAELKEEAKKKLILRFGIQKLVDEKEITVSEEELESHITTMLEPLSEEERNQVRPLYEKGMQAWHQLEWQKRVEKLMDELLA